MKQAAAVLEGELASGLVGVRRMQERFTSEQRIDQGEFDLVLERFRSNAHDLIALAGGRVADLRSDEVQDLSERLTTDAHEVLDTFLGLAALAPDILNRLAAEGDSMIPTSAAGTGRPSRSSATSPSAARTRKTATAKAGTRGRGPR